MATDRGRVRGREGKSGGLNTPIVTRHVGHVTIGIRLSPFFHPAGGQQFHASMWPSPHEQRAVLVVKPLRLPSIDLFFPLKYLE